jgi:hypothetical protein
MKKNALRLLLIKTCKHDNAKQICLSQEVGDPSLIQINSLEEQRLIEKLLFNDNKIVEFVWLGAKLDTKTQVSLGR